MSSSPESSSAHLPNSSVHAQQRVENNYGQTVGQVTGGMLIKIDQLAVYLSSQPPRSESFKSQLPRSEDNPYKELLAFQETDGDRFFGREEHIKILWNKFRDLHEEKSLIRLLPIYGPSGSGKSSLARAGLIPKLALNPLLGYDKAKLAILVPGTHPLEALARVLASARVASDSPDLVGWQNQFEEILKQRGKDGLRYIATNFLPEIHLSPLIILVDQFEEVYAYANCEDAIEKNEFIVERDAFIENLLCAAADRSKSVSIIITLRSDFLSETQNQPELNRLFSEQGFLVPAMSEKELKDAIRKPAELTGHPLDDAVVQLLLEQTIGREGSLPLLQFTLTRIWDKWAEGISPVMALEELKGVGGALAEEAKRVFKGLGSEEQKIAKRIFLELAQLGEGTRDTRRRVIVENLFSYQDNPTQVREVIEQFAKPGMRLITLAANRERVQTAKVTHEMLFDPHLNQPFIETVEVTHETLFEHWDDLEQWLNDNRNLLRRQRELQVDAERWKKTLDESKRRENDGKNRRKLSKSEDYLLRGWKLSEAEEIHRESNKNRLPLSLLIVEFIDKSHQRSQSERFSRISALTGIIGVVSIAACIAVLQWNQAAQSEIRTLAALSESQLENDQLNALKAAVKAGRQLQQFRTKLPFIPIENPTYIKAVVALEQAVDRTQEINRMEAGDGVFRINLSLNGQLIISTLVNNKVKLWKIDGSPLESRNYNLPFTKVSFSADENGGVINLWQASKLLKKFKVQSQSRLTNARLSPDNRFVAAGYKNGTIQIWNENGERKVDRPSAHQSSIYDMSFSRTSELLASASQDKTVKVWKVTEGALLLSKTLLHADEVTSVSFSPNGTIIASGTFDGKIKLWNLDGAHVNQKDECGAIKESHERRITDIRFISDELFLTASDDGSIKQWQIKGCSLLETLKGSQSPIRSIDFGDISPYGKVLVSGDADGTVRLWQLSDPSDHLYQQGGRVDTVSFSRDGKFVASAGSDGIIKLWNRNTEKLIEPRDKHMGSVLAIQFSPIDSHLLVSAGADGTVKLWEVTDRGVDLVDTKNSHERWVRSISFSRNGKYLVSAGGSDKDPVIRLWSVQRQGLVPLDRKSMKHDKAIYSTSFSANDQTLASAGADGTIKLWNAFDDGSAKSLSEHEGVIKSIDFSPDGKILASAGQDKTIKLWNISNGQKIRSLLGHTSTVTSISFSPDGKTLASSSEDKTIKLWDVKDGLLLYTLQGNQGYVNSVRFSPNGEMLLSGGGNGADDTVRLWNLNLGSLLEQGCNRIRNYLHTNPDVQKDDRYICG